MCGLSSPVGINRLHHDWTAGLEIPRLDVVGGLIGFFGITDRCVNILCEEE